ncbi:hypothetical protein Esti_002582 [Eimeria stiedai]
MRHNSTKAVVAAQVEALGFTSPAAATASEAASHGLLTKKSFGHMRLGSLLAYSSVARPLSLTFVFLQQRSHLETEEEVSGGRSRASFEQAQHAMRPGPLSSSRSSPSWGRLCRS